VLQHLSADHIRELRQAAPVIGGLFDVLEPRRASQAPRRGRKSTARKKK